MNGRANDRQRGMAIVAALYFITIVGVLAVAVLFGARQWARSGGGALRDAAQLARADELLVALVGDWNSTERAEQPVGSRVNVVARVARSADRIDAATYITRLNRTLYWLQADVGAARSSAGRHRINLLVRVPVWTLPTRSPLVSAGDVMLSNAARILGAGGGSSACVAGVASADAAITLPPAARLVLASGYPEAEQPEVRADSSARAPVTAYVSDGASWDALAVRADVRLPADAHRSPRPETDASGCVDNLTNWGEPLREVTASPCERRRRVIYAAGDLTLDGGRGQGALLVDGRLRLAGPFLWSGVVIARGGIETMSDGVDIAGVVISGATNAAHAGDAPVSLHHAATIRFAPCDAQQGMTSTMRAHVVRERAWAELF